MARLIATPQGRNALLYVHACRSAVAAFVVVAHAGLFAVRLMSPNILETDLKMHTCHN